MPITELAMVNGKLLTEKLIAYAKLFLHLDDLDEIYARNTLLAEFKLDSAYVGEADLEYVKEMSVPDVLFNETKDYSFFFFFFRTFNTEAVGN